MYYCLLLYWDTECLVGVTETRLLVVVQQQHSFSLTGWIYEEFLDSIERFLEFETSSFVEEHVNLADSLGDILGKWLIVPV